MSERFNNWTDVANMKDHIRILEQRVDFMREKLEAIDKQEPAAYVPYGVFDAWLDQAWLGVKCLNPQLCDPDKVDVQAIYAYPRPERDPLTGERLLRAAQSCLSPQQYEHFEALLENDPDAHDRLARAIDKE